ncbi:acetate uptake transporter [Bartonella sp. DGB2]|uniref:acetate uptake transporter n=1 Tax=Bartonella sp. DGB2 TaxID=3388426 RepID=UPI00398FE4BC
MQNTTQKFANPGPLGLSAFGLTTVLLNVHNSGFFPLSTVIISMGIFYGGIAQVIAGIMAFRQGKTFPATAFTSFGFFWIGLVAIWLLPTIGGVQAASGDFLAVYLGMWGIFAFCMTCALKGAPFMLKVVFVSLDLLFLFLVLGLTVNASFIPIAGYVGLFCGASALYTGMAELVNEQHGRTVWPI